MVKKAIFSNALSTMVVMVINFAFKIYLAAKFSKNDLSAYYTIVDIFTILIRVFIGYKDALTTLYYKEDERMILGVYLFFFIGSVLLLGGVVLPVSMHFYFSGKFSGVAISQQSVVVLFLLMNLSSFFTYLFLVHKAFTIVAIKELATTLLFVGGVLVWVFLGSSNGLAVLLGATAAAHLSISVWLGLKLYKKMQTKEIPTPSLAFETLLSQSARAFVRLTLSASSGYFVYGLILFAPVFVMLRINDISQLADFQVVARSIYFALVAVFAWPLGRFLFPEFSDMIAKKEFERFYALRVQFIKGVAVFGVFVIGASWLGSEFVVDWIFPAQYHNSYKLINILIVALPFVMYTHFSESIIKASGYYKENLIIKIAALFGFALFYVLFFDLMQISYAPLYAFTASMLLIALLSALLEGKIRKSWRE